MVRQENNIVGRDQVGRDKFETHYHVPRTHMSELIDRYKKECQSNTVFHDKVEELEAYCSPASRGDVLGLDEKLENGGYSDFREYAVKTKERFFKKLVRFQLYESAQRIYAFVLADVCTRYHNDVYPLVLEGKSQAEIHSAIQRNVVDPVQAILEENVLGIMADEINGALYFLTGNCHIKWV